MLPNIMVSKMRYLKRFFFVFLAILTISATLPTTSSAITIADLRADKDFKEFDYGTTLLDPDFDIDVKTPFSTACDGEWCWYKIPFQCQVSIIFVGCVGWGFGFTLWPATEIVMTYKEPTVYLEVVSRRGHSMLDFEGELAIGALDDKGSGQAGNVTKNSQYYEARVWGIGPNGRLNSRLDDDVAAETMACDIANQLGMIGGMLGSWSISHMSISSVAPLDGMVCDIIAESLPGSACDHPHRNFLKVIETITGIDNFLYLGFWQLAWFWYTGTPDPSKELHLIFNSEDIPNDWNSKVKETGADNNADAILGAINDKGMIENCESIQSFRTLSGMLLLFAPEVHFVPGCIGSWGSLLPRNGWYTGTYNNMTTKALIAWRAYDRALTQMPPSFAFFMNGFEKYNKRSIYPETLVPENTTDEAGDINYAAQGYFATEFNLEWPHHMTSRRHIGTDVHNWSGLSSDATYKTETTPELLMRLTSIQAYMDAGIELKDVPEDIFPKDDFVEDDLIMTLWKDTECCVGTCSNPYYWVPAWFVADGRDWPGGGVLIKQWDYVGWVDPDYPWEIKSYENTED